MRNVSSPALTGLLCLTTTLGLGALRGVFPALLFGIRDRFRWSALGAKGTLWTVAIAFGIFALVFITPWLGRRFGHRRALAGTALTVPLATLMAQLWPGDALGQVVALSMATVAFLIHVGLVFEVVVDRSSKAGSGGGPLAGALVLGLLGGLTLDAAITGASLTYDPVWRNDPMALALTAAVFIGQLILARRLTDPGGADGASADEAVGDGTIGDGAIVGGAPWAWAAFGPWLFLELLLLQNIAAWATLAEIPPNTALLWLLGGRLLTLWAAGFIVRYGQPSTWPEIVSSGILLVVLSTFEWSPDHRWFQVPVPLITAVLTQYFSVTLLIHLVDRTRLAPGRSRAVHGVGAVLLLAFVFLFYATYDLPLPLTTEAIMKAAPLLVALAAFFGTPGRGLGAPFSPWPLFAGAALLVLVPWMPKPEPTPSEPTRSLRVMSYNIHCGFGPDGLMQLEDQARAIEEQDPDIVALQEVSRGWLINGSYDTLEWLAQRLDMEYRFAPTADPLWGNAILSKRPILSHRSLEFPKEGQRLARGALEVTVDLGNDELLHVINTHFHHRRTGGAIREAQSQALLDFWCPPRTRTVVMGDLNATPNTPEISMLHHAGLLDVLDEMGLDEMGLDGTSRHTFRTGALERQLDYVLISRDLAVRDALVSPNTASDHLGVAAHLELLD